MSLDIFYSVRGCKSLLISADFLESYKKIEFPNIIIAPVIDRLGISRPLILKIESGFPLF